VALEFHEGCGSFKIENDTVQPGSVCRTGESAFCCKLGRLDDLRTGLAWVSMFMCSPRS